MEDNSQLIAYAVGGVFVIILLYSFRDYILIGLVSLGAISMYKIYNDYNNGSGRH
jgi:hypothetical protein